MLNFWIGSTTASEKGLHVESISPPVCPSRRLTLQTVPGRDGYVALGDSSFNQYVRYAEVFCEDQSDLAAVWDWLLNAQTVRFSSDSTHYLKCAHVDLIEPEYFARGSCSFTIGFTCQPFRYKYPESTAVTVASGGTITNSGNYECEPKIIITATGDCTVCIGSEQIDVTGGSVVIDSELRECLSADETELANSRVTLYAGAFPKLSTGNTTVTYTGATSVQILKRERDL